MADTRSNRIDEKNASEIVTNLAAKHVVYDNDISNQLRKHITIKNHAQTNEMISYNQMHQLGEGSFGKVYFGESAQNNKILAVKIQEINKNKLNLCQREIEVMYQFKNAENIVQYYGSSYDKTADRIFIAMEYAPNGTLYSWLKDKNPLTQNQKLEIGVGIANGLCFMHQASFIHRDIKTDNILLDNHLQPWISDFGFTEHVDNISEHDIVGNRLYRAPELLRTRILTSQNPSTDMYAYALLLWCTFSGNPNPFQNKDIEQLEDLYNWVYVDNSREDLPDKSLCPDKVRDVIEQCWDKNPRNRLSAADAYTALSNQCIAVQSSNIEKITPPFCYSSFMASPSVNDTKEYLKNNDALVKSIRFDGLCFNELFTLSVTKSPKNQIKEYFRPLVHKEFTVTAAGAVSRSKKPLSYSPLSKEEILNKKMERSSFQSTTLVTPDIQTPVFGHDKSRANKLTGYLLDPKDALINRIYYDDVGTVFRPYEFHTYEEAIIYFKKVNDPKKRILFSTLEELKQAILSQPNRYNEILACIRWDVNTSAVGIFSDTYEARCIAQLYASQMHSRLKNQYAELGKPWDDKYEIPIIYYIPGNEKNWTVYTKKQQKQDRQQANAIFENQAMREEAFAKDNFEFLLLLDNPKKIFDVYYQNMSILKFFLYQGKFQFIDAFCYLTDLKNEHEMMSYCDLSIPITIDPCIDDQSNTALHLAARSGRLSSLTLLRQLDVNSVNSCGLTPLIVAIQNNKIEAVNILIGNEYIDINYADKQGNTALMYAVENNNLIIIKLLMSHKKVKTNIQNAKGETALVHAIKYNLIEAAAQLINNQCVEINLADKNRCTPLICAVINNRIEIANMLLAHKYVDVNQKNGAGNTPLIIAIIYNNLNMVSLLLNHPYIDLNAMSESLHITALDCAKSYQKEDIAELIMKVQKHNESKLDAKLVTSVGLFNQHSKQEKLRGAIESSTTSNTSNNQNKTRLRASAGD